MRFVPPEWNFRTSGASQGYPNAHEISDLIENPRFVCKKTGEVLPECSFNYKTENKTI